MSEDSGTFWLGFIIATFVWFIVAGLFANLAAHHPYHIKPCQKACESNGGLKLLYYDHDCECGDGAFFDWNKIRPGKE